ncbi:MAG: tetratricopeptide repeat protein [bacterium]
MNPRLGTQNLKLKTLILVLILIRLTIPAYAAPRSGAVHYLMGHHYQDLKIYAKAIKEYEGAIETDPLLADYARYYLAECYAQAGNYQQAVQEYQRLITDYPESLRAPSAGFEIARCLADLGRLREAIEQYKSVLKDVPAERSRDEIYYLIGRNYERLKAVQETLENYRRIESKSYFGLEAAKRIEALRQGGVQITDEDRYKVALAYYEHQDYPKAIEYLKQFIKRYPYGKYLSPKARYYLGQCYSKTKKYALAISEYHELVTRYPKGPKLKEAYYEAARDYERMGTYRVAIEKYRVFGERFPQSNLADDAYYRMGICCEELGDASVAITAYQKVIKDYPKGDMTTRTLKNLAQIYLKQGKFTLMIETFRKLVKGYPDSQFVPQAQFWIGRDQEKLNNYQEAVLTYQALIHHSADSFYAQRARLRLEKILARESETESKSAPIKPKMPHSGIEIALDLPKVEINPGPNLDYLKRTMTFLEIERYQEALEQLRGLRKRLPQLAYSLLLPIALIYQEQGAYSRAIANAEAIASESAYRPERLKYLLYPKYYDKWVEGFSHKYDLDPLLVYAVIREESRFGTGSTSWANAQGLMQIIPSTGQWIAKELGFESFRNEQIYEPERNIQMGCFYLAHLLQAYNNNLVYALAAYNGGSGNVSRWQTSSTDVDEFMFNITFPETERYVEKIVESYNAYKRIYSQ